MSDPISIYDAEEHLLGLRAAGQFVSAFRFEEDTRLGDIKDALNIVHDLICDAASTLEKLFEQEAERQRQKARGGAA